ncbi:NADAR family protein [Xanthocytophaga agilis]|uniref:NADAR family protein n=1 Tax=Xanthocytophaga agilis TaxID=3048010 RepID=A0AAE3R6F0_9BACT|nr:NADAR family protein [Xanthocytophaga agilis]MDJ1502300.1 NADAR family protein [Xanthocytophaga agilis]
MNYHLDWLIEKYENNERLKYVFFWGHQPSKDGSLKETCFSQWWLSAFEVDTIIYQTAEHWMMAQKARLFNDKETLKKILIANTPAEAKKLGREVRNFDPVIWDENKYAYVKEGNIYKFSQHPDLKEYLLNTGDRILVEASPVDRIWGIGMAKDNPDIENPRKWKGENLLGFALMEARDVLGKE